MTYGEKFRDVVEVNAMSAASEEYFDLLNQVAQLEAERSAVVAMEFVAVAGKVKAITHVNAAVAAKYSAMQADIRMLAYGQKHAKDLVSTLMDQGFHPRVATLEAAKFLKFILSYYLSDSGTEDEA